MILNIKIIKKNGIIWESIIYYQKNNKKPDFV
jgi:hypothetical protein